jgi:hypothetical protein
MTPEEIIEETVKVYFMYLNLEVYEENKLNPNVILGKMGPAMIQLKIPKKHREQAEHIDNMMYRMISIPKLHDVIESNKDYKLEK